MDEDFKDVTKSSKLIGVIFLLVIVGISIGGYFLVYKPIHFSLKTIELELGTDLSSDVKDYLSGYGGNLANYKLDTSKVDNMSVGEYNYSMTNGKITKKSKIKVVDTTPPEFTLRELTIEEGSTDYYLGDFLEECEDYSKPCLVSLKNGKDDSKFASAGKYTIEVEVSDVYNNKKTAKATLNVVEKGKYVDPRSLDLEYASNSKGTEEFTGKIFKSLDKALNSQTDESRDELSSISTIDLESYVQENHPGYRLVSSEIIELYNKSHFVIGYAIELKITNGTEMTVYVDGTKLPTVPTEPDQEDQTE